jgi:putative intracellular protease/amidase
MSKQLEALMFVADGSDALNVCMTRTILDRAGVKTTLALVRSPTDAQEHRGVKLAAVLHGRGQSDDLESAFTVFADVLVETCGIGDAEKYDLLVFPGGLKGSSTLAANSRVAELAKRHWASSRA